jgi:protein-tyrosine phosphatase
MAMVMRPVIFAEEAPDPAKITDYLYLGSIDAAQSEDKLRGFGITHVLNCADDVDCYFPDTFRYMHLKIEDGGQDTSIVDAFQTATHFIETARSSGGVVLVHCLMGINRSATVTLAVLMNLEGWSLAESFDHVVQCRSCVCPFAGNKEKISSWELETRGACSLDDWLPPSLQSKPFMLDPDLDIDACLLGPGDVD